MIGSIVKSMGTVVSFAIGGASSYVVKELIKTNMPQATSKIANIAVKVGSAGIGLAVSGLVEREVNKMVQEAEGLANAVESAITKAPEYSDKEMSVIEKED